MVNRFIYEIIQDSYLSFIQKCRAIIFEIFGHESIVNSDNIENTYINEKYETIVYALTSLSINQMAWRKLLNPFKWIEFTFAFPLDLIIWFFCRVPFITKEAVKESNFFLQVTELIYRVISHYIILPIFYLGFNLLLGSLRRVFAPVRTIVRPTLELYYKYPGILFGLIFVVVGLSSIVAIGLFTGGLALPWCGILLTNIIAVLSIACSSWLLLLKASTLIIDISTSLNSVAFEKKTSEFFKNQQGISTTRITEMVHGLNADLTDIKSINEQNTFYKFCLLTGLEALFFKKEHFEDFEDFHQESLTNDVKLEPDNTDDDILKKILEEKEYGEEVGSNPSINLSDDIESNDEDVVMVENINHTNKF